MTAEPVPYGLDILRIRASKGEPSAPHHLKWSLDYDTARHPTSKRRAVFGTLHVGGNRGWGDVTVASLFSGIYELDGDELEDAIRDSDAAESVYDFARSHLVGLLATVGAEVDVPRKAPEAEIDSFDSSEHAPENEEVLTEDAPQ